MKLTDLAIVICIVGVVYALANPPKGGVIKTPPKPAPKVEVDKPLDFTSNIQLPCMYNAQSAAKYGLDFPALGAKSTDVVDDLVIHRREAKLQNAFGTWKKVLVVCRGSKSTGELYRVVVDGELVYREVK